MKGLIISLLLTGLVTTVATAQDEDVFSIGPRLGVNFADVTDVDGSEAKVGLVAGITSTYSISETVGLTLDLLYSKEGYKIDGGPEVDLTYLQIPLYLDVFFGELGQAFRPKIYAGIAPGILLSAETNEVDTKDMWNSFVFSFTGGGGFNYRLGERVWLNTDLRAFLGLSDIRDEAIQTDEKVSSRNIQLSLGVAFGL